jgi:hypothetical protein
VPLGRKDFILQVHRVYTRIRLEALLVASSGGACGSANYGAAAVARVTRLLARSISIVATVVNGKP